MNSAQFPHLCRTNIHGMNTHMLCNLTISVTIFPIFTTRRSLIFIARYLICVWVYGFYLWFVHACISIQISNIAKSIQRLYFSKFFFFYKKYLSIMDLTVFDIWLPNATYFIYFRAGMCFYVNICGLTGAFFHHIYIPFSDPCSMKYIFIYL